jgi:hypothetical protein
MVADTRRAQRTSYHLMMLLMAEADAHAGAVYRVDPRTRRIELIAASPEFSREGVARVEVTWHAERTRLAAGSPCRVGHALVLPLCDEIGTVRALLYMEGVADDRLDGLVLMRLREQVAAVPPIDLRDLLSGAPEATAEARAFELAQRIRAALHFARGRRDWAATAARELGWSRTKLYEKMRGLGIQRP